MGYNEAFNDRGTMIMKAEARRLTELLEVRSSFEDREPQQITGHGLDGYGGKQLLINIEKRLQATQAEVLLKAGKYETMYAICRDAYKVIVEARKKKLFDDPSYREALLNGLEQRLKVSF